MQLVAYGAQDVYLTGNPQITFFKVVYRRHTNFSMESIVQTVNGSNTLSTSSTNTAGTVTISRNGDLVSKVYVRCNQDTADGVSGDQLIKDVELEIGGQRVDKHTREWLQVWAELSTPDSHAAGYKYLTGGFSNTLVSAGTTGTNQQSVMVPLQFWFCRNPGLALPLIALQYHEVKLKFTWGTRAEASRDASDDMSAPTCEVWCDYIYLDTDERRRFAQVSHEYLIEQLQVQGEGSAKTSNKLNFNHPVKELIWTNTSSNITDQKAKLVLNGHDRFAAQTREYFQVRQPLDYHTAVPGYNIKETERPQMLATPLPVGAATLGALNTYGDGTTDIDAGAVTLAANNGSTPRVGDVVVISMIDDESAAVSQTVVTTVATVASATSFTVDASVGVDTSFSIHIVARSQDPQSRCSQLMRDVNVYSFALKPEEHQPSGTCNFSRIDNAQLEFSGTATVENIYAVNYNVLRIMSGMGGLAYSN